MTVINNYTNIDYLRMGGGLRFKKGNFGGGGVHKFGGNGSDGR